MISAAITVFSKSAHELRASARARRTARSRERPLCSPRFLGLAAGAARDGAVAGFLMALFLPRFLPASAAMTAASTVMGEDRWNAGAALMELETRRSGTLYGRRPCGLDEQSRALRLPGRRGQGEEKAAMPVRHWWGERGLKERLEPRGLGGYYRTAAIMHGYCKNSSYLREFVVRNFHVAVR